MALIRRIRPRAVLGGALTVLAAVALVAALVVPDGITRAREGVFLPGAFLRLPIELIVAGAVVLALPVRRRRPVAALLGVGIGLLVVLKVANAGFRTVLGRRFDPVTDPPLVRDGYQALVMTDGRTWANLAVAGAVLLLVGTLAGLVLAAVRLAGVATRHSLPARRTLAGLAAAWIALAFSGLTLYPDAPVASDSAATLLKSTARQVPATIRDRRQFADALRHDPYATVPAADLVSGLRGKDVVIGVVESYGRSVLTDPRMSAIVGPALDATNGRLAAAGFRSRIGWLTSPTYGGGSWLAHASFQSGLWVTDQGRYDEMAGSDRLTLTRAFHESGWHTTGVEPGNTEEWKEAGFYGYDRVLDKRNLGYRGPKFGWSPMPDQYVMSVFQREVYARRQGPMMAEVTLTSSHTPWTSIPTTVPAASIGDGRVFAPMAAHAVPRSELWADVPRARAEYARSIVYSVDSLLDWAREHGDDNLVLVVFGDHQPMSMITGPKAGRDIPVTVVAKDAAVLDRIASWGWQDGLRPAPDGPVWRMDEFRDRFFTAYGRRNGVALGHR